MTPSRDHITFAETSDARSQAEEAISALIAAAVRHQSEPESFLDLHAEDVVIVNIAGRRVSGRSELGAAMREALANSLSAVATTVEVHDIRFVRTDVAIVSCTKHVHDDREGSAETLPSCGAMSYVVEESDAGWRIALAQTTPVRS